MKLLLFDGNSVINRAFYGIRALSTREGVPTNAVVGFINIYQKMVTREQPELICVAFDRREPTFRHKRYEGYKAQRKGMPDELAAQMPLVKEWLDKMGIPRLELAGFEADDIIGTLAARCDGAGVDCVIVTGDRDDLALCSDRVTVALTATRGGASETRDYTPETVREEYGFPPERITDYKAICGDTSDNIPGVAGIGDKGARALLAQFGSLEEIYRNLSEIKGAQAKKLEASREMALLSYELATICKEAPVEVELPELAPGKRDVKGLASFYEKYEMRSFLKKLELPEEEKAALEPPETETLTAEMLAGLAGEVWYLSLSEGVLRLGAGARCYRTDDEALVRAVCEAETPKVVEDWKTLCTALRPAGIRPEGLAFDLSLAAYLVNPSASSYALPLLCGEYLGAELLPGAEPLALERLHGVLSEKLAEEGSERLYAEVELPLCRVLTEMEELGVRVDAEKLRLFGEALGLRIAEIERSVFDAAGCEFNLSSPKQLGEVLFEKLGLPAGKKTKTGYSTGADQLERLRKYNPIADDILEHRTLSKLKGTYADGLLKVIGPDGRIHSTFQQTVTQTGRISSTEPNLQNIPVREEIGREIRRLFIPAEGCVLLDADYSQIELRVLAHISGDETMINAFLEGEDIHTVTASQVFGVPRESVTPEMRRRAKAVNFGIVYGISDFSLAQDIHVSRAEAKEYIEGYFHHYPKIKRYLDETVAQAKKDGYVTTMFGRRRYIPELASRNYNLRSFGERVAMNTPIQGAAADIIKIAMVRVWRALREEGFRTKLILQVHDELILEGPKVEAARAAALLKREMEAAAELRAPLLVEVGSGESWLAAK